MQLKAHTPEYLATFYERLEARSVGGENGCRLWIGALTGQKYPAIRFMGDLWAIHRLLMTIEHGVIGDGMEVDHICFNKTCINPEHLRVIPMELNRSLKDPRNRGLRNSSTGEWGIYPHLRGKLQVRIRKEGVLHTAGTHIDLSAAIEARDALIAQLWPEGLITEVQKQAA